MPAPRAWKTFVARHLYSYLALLCGLAVVVLFLFGREALGEAWASFRPAWAAPVLALSLINYGLRFLKWDRLLRDCDLPVPFTANARLYFACLAMVVTPGRLGELYKLVFLRRLHRIPASRSLSPLLMERITDALAVVILIGVRFVEGAAEAVAVVVAAGLAVLLVGAVLAAPTWSRRAASVCARLPGLRSRAGGIEAGLLRHRVLLRPHSLGPALGLSLVAWWAECWGLYCILQGLGAEVGILQATWVYALATILGNLTFLPGGLGATELSLVALLSSVGVVEAVGIGAMVLIRAATLWFAVVLGLVVSLVFRRDLQWDAVRHETESAQADA